MEAVQRIALLGAVQFSRSCLIGILGAEGVPTPKLVIGLDPELAFRHSDYEDLAAAGKRAGIYSVNIQSANEESTVTLLASHQIDLLVVVGWSEVLSARTLGTVRRTVGSHPSLLPLHRGHHPLIWPLVLGLDQTGVTFLDLSERVDAGPILWQCELPIHRDDRARDLYDRAAAAAASGLMTFLPSLVVGDLAGRPQIDEEATYWRKRTFSDGCINPMDTADTAYNLVRALSEPYPGAHLEVRGVPLKVWRSEFPLERPSGARPGEVTAIDGNHIRLHFRDSALVLTEHEIDVTSIRIGEIIG